jgi:hypothetical protein
MYVFWHFAFLPLWPLPASQPGLARAAGIVLEVFVNPLNLVPPGLPWVGLALPLALLLAGAVRLWRRCFSVWIMLVAPIGLAMIASALKRYPFHGRLILELVPALFLLIAEGTQALFELDYGRRKLGYKAVVVLLLAYPSLFTISDLAGMCDREFNNHGDWHKNVFLYEQRTRPIPHRRADERPGESSETIQRVKRENRL